MASSLERPKKRPRRIETAPARLESGKEDALCSFCDRLDFQSAFSIDPEELRRASNQHGLPFKWVGKQYRKLDDPKCPLCRILSSSRIRHQGPNKMRYDNERDPDEIRLFSFLTLFNGIDVDRAAHHLDDEDDSIVLVVMPSPLSALPNIPKELRARGFAVCQRKKTPGPNMPSVQVVPARFTPRTAVAWIEYCQKNHRHLCNKPQHPVTGLKLIDCDTHTVIDAPADSEYVALSYVWGSSKSTNEQSDALRLTGISRSRSDLPQVVSDALVVTAQLGYKYLWIDKYCIDQDDPKIKAHQIAQMDRIYQNAELTIIAAAGDSENFGLPGVGISLRAAQQKANLDSVRVISSMSDPHIAIRSSTYSKRGWTFQEASLSRRRLVFMNEQTYFECKAMNCFESISGSLDHMHTKNRAKFREFMRAGVFGRNERSPFGLFNEKKLSPSQTFNLFLSSVEEYSGRDLTNEEDSLNAFLGVIRNFERRETPVLQLWGIPFLFLQRPTALLNSMVDGLAWVHEKSCWEGDDAPRRRAGFPSWSWAGWKGKAQYPRAASYVRSNGFETEVISMSCESESGEIKELEWLYNSESKRYTLQSPGILRLSAYVIPPEAFTYHSYPLHPNLSGKWKVLGRPTSLVLSKGASSPDNLSWLLQAQKCRFTCIYLGCSRDQHFGLILEVREGFYVRAGAFITTSSSFHKLLEGKGLREEEFRIK